MALGQCLLRTTRESFEENQPVLNEAGSAVLVFDGRLDNWESLRLELLELGARLRNRSDSELVMQAFGIWGKDCVDHIEGDFAFVLWDSSLQEAFCARDRMGNKPLHYYWNGTEFFFASEVTALLASGIIPKVANDGMLADHLSLYWCTRDETLWKDISRLVAAHTIKISKEGLKLREYWKPDLSKQLEFADDEDYIRRYLELLREAVRRCSRSHLPTCFEVSGGLDSSALFALAEGLGRAGELPAPDIEGYTLAFSDDADADERSYASAVGEHLGRPVHEVQPTAPSLDWLRQWAARYGELPPYPNSSMAIGIRERVASQCRALVVGVGGDEWLVASRRYYAEEIRSRRWRRLSACFKADAAEFGASQATRWLLRFGIGPLLPARVRKVLNHFVLKPHAWRTAGQAWLTPSLRRLASSRMASLDARLDDPVRQVGQRGRQAMLLSPANIEAKESEERLAANWGVELRWPFYNLQLAEFMFATPERIRLRGSSDKYVHRQALVQALPKAVLERRTKADFMVTYRRYLGQMQSEFLNELPRRRKAWVDPETAEGMYRATQAGPTRDGGFEWQLWGLFCCDAVMCVDFAAGIDGHFEGRIR